MEFNFDVEQVFTQGKQPQADGIEILDARDFNPSTQFSMSHAQTQIAQVVDQIGENSAIAQGLGATITTFQKLLQSENHILYMKVQDNQALGFIKTGQKNLFITVGGQMKQINARCVLDFYVHESVQRCGLGKKLFEKMMAHEKLAPWKFGYDRPSEKLLAFLAKHYLLSNYTEQVNHFVVYEEYFTGPTLQQQQKMESSSQPARLNRQQQQNYGQQSYSNNQQSWTSQSNSRPSSRDQWSSNKKSQYSQQEIAQWSQPAARGAKRQQTRFEDNSQQSYNDYPPPKKQQTKQQYQQEEEESSSISWVSKSANQNSRKEQSWQPKAQPQQEKQSIQWASSAQPQQEKSSIQWTSQTSSSAQPQQEKSSIQWASQASSNNYANTNSYTSSYSRPQQQQSYQSNQYQREPYVQTQAQPTSYNSSMMNRQMTNQQPMQSAQSSASNSFQFYPAPQQSYQVKNQHYSSQYYDDQSYDQSAKPQKKISNQYTSMHQPSKLQEWTPQRDPTEMGTQWVSRQSNQN